MKTIDVFLTGGTGLIGRWLVPELTRLGHSVGILMRKADQRSAPFKDWVNEHNGFADQIVVLEGDLSQSRLGLSDADYAIAQTAHNFYHLGAIQGFGLAPEIAERINLFGTQEMFALAKSTEFLNRFIMVSGFRLFHFLKSGESIDSIDGEYEASKVRADLAIRETAARENIPVTFIHPGTVIGDSQTGETSQFGINFFEPLEDLWHGRVPAIPGTPEHWLPLLTVDYLAAFMARIPSLDWSTGEDFTVLDNETPPLGELFNLAADHMGVQAPSKYVPIPIMRFLLKAGLGKLTGQSPEGLSFIDTVRYDTSSSERAAAEMGLVMPNLIDALRNNIDYLVGARFGKNHPRPGAAFYKHGDTVTFGQGNWQTPKIILLHGLPLDSDSWDDVAEQLPQGDVLRIDLPGNGRSGGLTTEGQVAWLDNVLVDVTDPVILVGHSLGTDFAIRYANSRPERVAGLVLISPFFWQSRPPLPLRMPLITSTLFKLGSRAIFENSVTGQSVSMTSMLDGTFENIKRRHTRKQVAHALAYASQPKVRDELSEMVLGLPHPIKIIAGEHDPFLKPIDEFEITIIQNAGHNPQFSDPRILAEEIKAMLTQVEEFPPIFSSRI